MSDEEMKSVAASCRHFYWKLFQSTFLISAFTVGGGFVIIPLLRAKYVDEYGWLDDKETLNLVSIAQSMPGTPVKVVWTRDGDIQHDFYHAVAADRLEAVLDFG